MRKYLSAKLPERRGMVRSPSRLTIPRPPPREITRAPITKAERTALFKTQTVPPADETADMKMLVVKKFSKPEKLGAGAYGQVYGATDSKGERVAIKLLYVPVADLDEIIKELLVMNEIARTKAPYLVPLEGISVLAPDPRAPYLRRLMIVLPRAELGDLAETLPDLRLFSDQEFAQLVLHLFCGLSQLHSMGVTHNDLKPENVLIFREGPKLADFGLVGLHQPAFRRGTPYLVTESYRSPEFLCTDDRDKELWSNAFSPQSDMWSMGIMLLEMILYKYHPREARRIWQSSTYQNDRHKRMIHLMQTKGLNPEYVQLCLAHQKIPTPLRRSLEKIPSSEDGQTLLENLFGTGKLSVTNSTEKFFLGIASALLQINPARRLTATQVASLIVSAPLGFRLQPCSEREPTILSALSPTDQTGKDLAKALHVSLNLGNIASYAVSDRKHIDKQTSQIQETYDRIVQGLHLTGTDRRSQQLRRAAFAVSVLLYWGGSDFAPYFLENYALWEFPSLLDLENAMLEVVDLLTKTPVPIF